MNIEHMLPVSKEFINHFNVYIDIGKNFLPSQKIVFLGLARNIEPYIDKVLEKLCHLGQQAKEYKIVIFENDSIDNTKTKLYDISQENTNIIYFSENNNRPHYGPVQDPERTLALAEYRNKLKDYVKNNLSDYDLAVVTDLDFLDFSTLGYYNSMGWLAKHSDTINAIAGNSFQYRSLAEGDEKKTLWNYDSWAYRQTWWYPLSQPEYFSYNIMTWFNLHIMPTGSQVISVNSAFGGMTIYRLQNFIKGEYNGRDCEHVTFHYSLKQANPDFQLVVNPSQIMLMS